MSKSWRDSRIKICVLTLVFLGISLLVISPTLKPGPILTLDNVTSPLQMYQFTFGEIDGVLHQKLFLTLIVTLGIAGTILALKKLHPLAVLLSSLLFISTPFYGERLSIGQWHLLFTISLLPWIFLLADLFYSSRSYNRIFILLGIAVLMAGMVFYYHRAINFVQIIIIAYVTSWIISQSYIKKWWVKLLLALVAIVTVIVILQIGSFKYGGILSEIVSPEHLDQFAIGQGPFWQRLVGSINYIGFWAERAKRTPIDFSQYWLWYILGLSWLLVAAVGWHEIVKKRPILGATLVGAYILGLLVVISNSQIVSPQSLYFGYQFLGFGGLRETGKFMGLMIVPQIIGFGYGIDYLLKTKKSTHFNKFLLLATIFSLSIIAPISLGIIHRELQPSPFPQELLKIAKQANQEKKKVIIFPWHRYQSYPFTNAKIIDQIAPSLFQKTVFNEKIEYGAIHHATIDPWQTKMAIETDQEILAKDKLNELLKELEIDRVLVFKMHDFEKYIVWADKANLTRISENQDFILYDFNG